MKINYGRYLRLWTAVMLTQSGEHHTQKTRRFKKEAHLCRFSTGIDFFKSFTVSPFASKRDSSAFCDLWYYRFKQEPKVHSFELVLTLGGSLESTDNEEFMMPFCFSGYG